MNNGYNELICENRKPIITFNEKNKLESYVTPSRGFCKIYKIEGASRKPLNIIPIKKLKILYKVNFINLLNIKFEFNSLYRKMKYGIKKRAVGNKK